MPRRNFRAWLRKQEAGDDLRGDFIRDALQDRQFPLRVDSWAKLAAYLNFRNACAEAMVAARELFDEFRREPQR